MWTENYQKYKLGFKEAEGLKVKLATFSVLSIKQHSSRINIYFCFIDYAKSFECMRVDHKTVSWETYTWVKKQ